MFKQLRNKFLILNLVIITVMIIAAFTSIFMITLTYVQNDIDMELHKIGEFYGKLKQAQSATPENIISVDFDSFVPHPERSISFTLFTDDEWTIQSIISIFVIDDSFYETAKKAAIDDGKNTGTFQSENYYWAYLITPNTNGYKMIFLDITPQQTILMNLIYTFLLVGSIMFIFIFLISRYFANKAIEPIQESFEKQKQFISDASHELKTPLSVIHTNVDVLLSNPEETIESQSKWLHYIQWETQRMSKLTKDLLYLTQMDYSEVKMIYSDCNVSQIVEKVLLTMEAVIFEKNIEFEDKIDTPLFTYGNPQQLSQVVMILLDNAVKYTNSLGKISVLLKGSHNTITFKITNTGDGIPEESLDRIFHRFYRRDKSRWRKEGGYGLGLAIAKAIIEQHGGKIFAKSVQQVSTTFQFELPRKNIESI